MGRGAKIGLILGFLLLVIGVAAYFLLPDFLGSGTSDDATQPTTQAQQEVERIEHTLVSIPAVQVNVRDGDTLAVASIGLDIKAVDGRAAAIIKRRTAPARDVVLATASRYTAGQLRSADGRQRLRRDLLGRINSAYPDAVIRDVYFIRLVVSP